jgi:hypothetical protein
MEALTAVSVACLTVYDMCKAIDRAMRIGDIRVLEKAGGRSGHYKARIAPFFVMPALEAGIQGPQAPSRCPGLPGQARQRRRVGV